MVPSSLRFPTGVAQLFQSDGEVYTGMVLKNCGAALSPATEPEQDIWMERRTNMLWGKLAKMKGGELAKMGNGTPTNNNLASFSRPPGQKSMFSKYLRIQAKSKEMSN
eukprot:EG_transcript_44637